MGKRGPKKQPPAIATAKGNPGHRSKKSLEDPAVALSLAGAGAGYTKSEGVGGRSESVLIPSPPWLTDEARKIWRAKMPELVKLNIMQRVDAYAFGRYCENFAMWLQAKRDMKEGGAWYRSSSPHGEYKRAHPAFMIADRLDRALDRAEANFGLNPADRQRLFLARSDNPIGDLFGHHEKPTKAPDEIEDVPPSSVGFGLVH